MFDLQSLEYYVKKEISDLQNKVDNQIAYLEERLSALPKHYDQMNLYLCFQTENRSYGTYDSFVCAAKSQEEARRMIPGMSPEHFAEEYIRSRHWCLPQYVEVKFIGTTNRYPEPMIIISSFNAG